MKTQIGGPTGAFVVIVSGIVLKHGIIGLYICTLLAGIMLVVLGATGFGSAVKFIPRPVVVGFTNGIAVIIARDAGGDLEKIRSDRCCRAREQPAVMMAMAEVENRVGRENICPHVEAALERARAIHADQVLVRSVGRM